MATQSPFLFIEAFLGQLPLPPLRPPAWAIAEAQRKVVLLLNHVLLQEDEALARLKRQQGRVVLVRWQAFKLKLGVTAAGLVDLATGPQCADLTMLLADASPLTLVGSLLRGDQPEVAIEGDVLLAAEVKWLVDHVRWDVEEDLSRVMGDAPAHALGEATRAVVGALRTFVAGGAAPESAGGTPA